MVEIKEQLKQDPSLIGEQPHDGDLYSTLFPKARKTRMHGLGLLVGGKKSECLDQAIVALRESTEENLHLRSLVEKLVASQNCLMARSQQMEEKLNLVLASKKLETSQEKTKDAEKELQDPTIKMEDNCEVKEVKEQLRKEVKEQLPKDNAEGSQKSYKQLESGLETSKEIEIGTKAIDGKKKSRKKKVEVKEQLPKDNAQGSQKSYKQLQSGLEIFREVKIEMVEKRNAEQKDQPSYYKKIAKHWQVHKIKRGMEVVLTSPKSEQLVALGTVQNVESGDYVEVLVTIVLKSTTILPQAQGRATHLGHAQSLCIHWPRKNVAEPDISPDHAGIISDMDDNLRVYSKPKLRSENEDPQTGHDKPAKRRKTANTTTRKSTSSNKVSQANVKVQNSQVAAM